MFYNGFNGKQLIVHIGIYNGNRLFLLKKKPLKL